MLSDIPLIPRKVLLGNPSRLNPKLSPDGKSLAWLAPVDGVMNIWAAPTDAISEARPITNTIGRPIVARLDCGWALAPFQEGHQRRRELQRPHRGPYRIRA